MGRVPSGVRKTCSDRYMYGFNDSIVRHGLLPPVEMECVGDVEAENRHAVEYREAE